MKPSEDLKMSNEFVLTEDAVVAARSKLAVLQRKAEALGLPVFTLDCKEEEWPLIVKGSSEYAVDPKDYPVDAPAPSRFVKRVRCKIVGDAPVLAGYRFVAKIEHLAEGNIIREVPGCHIPSSFQKAPPLCQHCGTTRPRHSTYVVQKVDDDGTGDQPFVQVGRQCLQDYLRSTEAGDQILQWAAWWESFLVEVAASSLSSSGGKLYWKLDDVVALASAFRDVVGWVTAAETNNYEYDGPPPSSSEILGYLIKPESWKDRPDYQEAAEASKDPKHIEEAAAVRSWVCDDLGNRKELSNYEANLVTIFRMGLIDGRQIALACSAVGAYRKFKMMEQDKKAEEKARVTRSHLGSPKDRMLLQVRVRKINGPYTGQYGDSFMCIMRTTDEKHDLVWWTGENLSLEEGETYDILATVTEHDDYNGIPQTKVNRVRVLDAEALAKEQKKRGISVPAPSTPTEGDPATASA